MIVVTDCGCRDDNSDSGYLWLILEGEKRGLRVFSENIIRGRITRIIISGAY